MSESIMAAPCPTCHGNQTVEVEDRRLTNSASLVQDFVEEDCPNPDCENGQIEVCNCGEVLRFCECEVEVREEIAA